MVACLFVFSTISPALHHLQVRLEPWWWWWWWCWWWWWYFATIHCTQTSLSGCRRKGEGDRSLLVSPLALLLILTPSTQVILTASTQANLPIYPPSRPQPFSLFAPSNSLNLQVSHHPLSSFYFPYFLLPFSRFSSQSKNIFCTTGQSQNISSTSHFETYQASLAELNQDDNQQRGSKRGRLRHESGEETLSNHIKAKQVS